MRFALAKFLHQRAHLRADRKGKASVGFVAVNDDASGSQIDISVCDRSCLSLPQSC